jgi:hypothetical protein
MKETEGDGRRWKEMKERWKGEMEGRDGRERWRRKGETEGEGEIEGEIEGEGRGVITCEILHNSAGVEKVHQYVVLY